MDDFQTIFNDNSITISNTDYLTDSNCWLTTTSGTDGNYQISLEGFKTNTGTENIVCGKDLNDNFLENILDRIIRLTSLTKKSFYETFKVKKINFLKKQTKIVCVKNVDLDYLDSLRQESIFLNEIMDNSLNKYKDKYVYDINTIGRYITYDNLYNNRNLTLNTNGTSTITLANYNYHTTVQNNTFNNTTV